MAVFACLVIGVSVIAYSDAASAAPEVMSGYTNKCLDDSHGRLANDTVVDIWTCNGTAAQQWTQGTGGTITLKSECLGVFPHSRRTGARIALYACNGSSNQQWTYTAGHELVVAASKKCLTIPGGKTVNGSPMALAPCTGAVGQTWYFTRYGVSGTAPSPSPSPTVRASATPSPTLPVKPTAVPSTPLPVVPSPTAEPTLAPTPTPTPSPSSSPVSDANCSNPSYSSSDAEATDNTDPSDGSQYWWVNNDAWSGSAGPQTIYVCNQSSWYVVSNQTDNGGQVETYPDTEYDVGGRDNPSTKTISQWNSISGTFAEDFPSAGSWDAGYDLWTNNWTNETMIWNQWAGSQDYWYQQATTTVSLDGVPYKFIDNGGELIFMRENQVQSGSVDILAAWQWEVANGYAKASDVPTQMEYGVEICATTGAETFPVTNVGFSLQ